MAERDKGDDIGEGVQRSFVIGQISVPVRPLEPALYVVSTPIGNLRDITLRALEVLAGADLLLCEDTRVTRVLLERYGIRRALSAYHDHNEGEAAPRALQAVAEGRSVALVSDAGTPLVSDPGYRLVTGAAEQGLRIVPVPGASAVLGALAVAGLPTDSFFFAGFLPAKAGQRRTRIDELAAVPGTLVFYESPRRLADVMPALAEGLGEARAAIVARELTKAFEEVRRGTLGELAAHYAAAPAPKGEAVICVAPPLPREAPAGETLDALLLELARTMPAAKAAGEAAKRTGEQKSALYKRLTDLKAGT